MEMRTFDLGALHTNCYLVHDGKEAAVIDPGGDPAPVLKYLLDNGLTLTHILNTHMHFDHILGNAALSAGAGAPIFANAADDFLLRPEMGGARFGLPPTPSFDYENLEPGELALAGERCTVLATPGHTPGSLSYYFPDSGLLFAGDALFYRSMGRTDLPGGDTETLYSSIKDTLFALPETTEVLPGHGIPTNIGDEKDKNPYVGKAARF